MLFQSFFTQLKLNFKLISKKEFTSRKKADLNKKKSLF